MPRPKVHNDNAERQRKYRERKKALRNSDALRNETIDAPAIRYYGGKFRIADWIIAQFPPHVCYVEPYAGAASVLLRKPAARHEVINDLNGDIVNFFRVIRDWPEQFFRVISLTPYSRLELQLAWERTDDPLESARRLWVRCWQSFGSGVGEHKTGWRFQKGATTNTRADAVKSFYRTKHLWAVASRLKSVQIECDDALKVIERYDSPNTLFYVDPPYVHSTRNEDNAAKGYAIEMSDADHRGLAATLRSVKGMIVLSGYPSALYDELYSDWRCLQYETTNVRSAKETECLWLSPNASSLSHLPMFSAQFR